MNIKNAIITAIRSLRRNKLRSMLTSIGIIIGVSSVILMIGLGSSARIEVRDKVANFGENGISLEMKPFGKRITTNDIVTLKNEIFEIDKISPICYVPEKAGLLKYRDNTTRAKMWGVNEIGNCVATHRAASGCCSAFCDLRSEHSAWNEGRYH